MNGLSKYASIDQKSRNISNTDIKLPSIKHASTFKTRMMLNRKREDMDTYNHPRFRTVKSVDVVSRIINDKRNKYR